jgi:hypothetical protein
VPYDQSAPGQCQFDGTRFLGAMAAAQVDRRISAPKPTAERRKMGRGEHETMQLREIRRRAKSAGSRCKGFVGSVALVVVFLVMIAAFYSFSAPTVKGGGQTHLTPACIPCPAGTTGSCYPNCTSGGGGGGGGCPKATVSVSIVSTSWQATNVKINWTTNPSTGVDSIVSWANSTIYNEGYYSSTEDVGSSTSIYINFLEPSTTYHFQIAGEASCYLPGDAYGTGATSSDTVTTFSGTVKDPNGALPPTNLLVLASCVLQGMWNSRSLNGSTWAKVTSSGSYSMSEPQWFNTHTNTWYACTNGGGGYSINVVNSPDTIIAGGNFENPQWVGHWNETVVTWAPQVVDFVLPLNYVSPYFPVILDFSDAPAQYSNIAFTSGTTSTLTTALTYSFSLGGGGFTGSYSTTTSDTFSVGSSGGVSSSVGNLDYIIQRETSGTVEFDAIYYSWSLPAVNLYGAYLNGEPAQQNPSYMQPLSWLVPGAQNEYYLVDQSVEKTMQDVLISAPGQDYTGTVTTETTTASTGDFGVSFSMPVALAGAPSLTIGVSAGWSQTSSTTYTNTLSWSVGVPGSGGSALCVDVFGQGGTFPDADMIGIYTWAPVNGACSGG